jgi:hypothetical protein
VSADGGWVSANSRLSAPNQVSAEPTIGGHGFSVTLPATWEGRIYQRPTPTTAFSPQNRAATGATRVPAAAGWLGEQTKPVLHLANFALPGNRGDYGSGAVEMMGPQNTFIAILEFGQECLGTALYSGIGLPRVSPDRFDPNGLQRNIDGQAGCQFFFTEQSRPMCLYVVLGSGQLAQVLSPQVNMVLDRVRVAAG